MRGVRLFLWAAFLFVPHEASACQQLPIIYFWGGSSTVNADGQATLRGFAQQALEWRERLASIRVVGHSDRTGTLSARSRISLRRAQAVRTVLIENGIPPGLIRVSEAGDSQPFVDTPENVREPLNRRVELQVSYTASALDEPESHPRVGDPPPALCG